MQGLPKAQKGMSLVWIAVNQKSFLYIENRKTYAEGAVVVHKF